MRTIFLDILAIFLFTTTAYCDDESEERSKIIEYNSESLAENINHFVMFSAPWCVHTKRLRPTWEKLAEMFNVKGSLVTISEVDCSKEIFSPYPLICEKQDVTEYPTMTFFSKDKLKPVRYNGPRDLPSLTNFLNEQLGSILIQHEDEAGDGVLGAEVLTDENNTARLRSGIHFVNFYAPWCGHCQRLAPTWEELATKLKNTKAVNIAKVDCTVDRTACSAYNVKSYPTLLWIKKGEIVDKYEGPRSLEDLSAYVLDWLGSASAIGKAESNSTELSSGSVVSLTSENFDVAISKGRTFVKFFAPWCVYCKSLAPTWDALGEEFDGDQEITIAQVDCTLHINKQLCDHEEAHGFPTLLLYEDGHKIDEHTGGRSFDELYDFVVNYGTRLYHDEL